MAQMVTDPKLRVFQRDKAARREKAKAKAAAPGAPNDTIARNVFKWHQAQEARSAKKK